MAPGRRPRAGERATGRTEVRWTLAELRTVRELARANGCSIADLVRVAVLILADDAGQAAPLVLGQDVLDRLQAIVSGSNSEVARSSIVGSEHDR